MRKSGKNLDITGMDWSSEDPYEDIVRSEFFALELALRKLGGGICAVEETAIGENAVEIEILADNLALVITD